MANPDHIGPFVKPSGMERLLAKHAKRVAKGREKRSRDMESSRAWDALRLVIFTRDRGVCRICGTALKFRSDNPREDSDTHHIVFRSAGGPDESWNLITACSWPCHEQIHRRVPAAWLDVTGNGDGEIVIQEINPETGRVVRQRESRVPERKS